uniref:Ankyrin repeat domain-containing protein 6-like n=1 Tax=Sinocyclocheilus anshuiensis TaxID=1608454 RepID=A0A671SQE9_9TELE
MNCRLGRIEQKNKHQIKVLEKLMQERVSAETMECHYRINQRATLERLADERKQVPYLKRRDALQFWCMSKIQDLDVRMPAETQYYKLLHSPSVDHSLVDSDPEGLPLLSLISEESSSSLATYVNVLPSPGAGPNNDVQSLEFGDTLEVFSQRPVEATFIQERANLHAMEVTQRFFETVSTQLERWYERKIQEAQKVAEQKAMQDRASLLEKINTLEEELQKLRTNTNTNS